MSKRDRSILLLLIVFILVALLTLAQTSRHNDKAKYVPEETNIVNEELANEPQNIEEPEVQEEEDIVTEKPKVIIPPKNKGKVFDTTSANGMGLFKKMMIPYDNTQLALEGRNPYMKEYVNSWQYDPWNFQDEYNWYNPNADKERDIIKDYFGTNPPMTNLSGAPGYYNMVHGLNPDVIQLFELHGEDYPFSGAMLLFADMGQDGVYPMLVETTNISLTGVGQEAYFIVNEDDTVDIYSPVPLWITAIDME